jgi:molecular chaperone GrpE (heat shock protein)
VIISLLAAVIGVLIGFGMGYWWCARSMQPEKTHDYLEDKTFRQIATLLTQYPTIRHMVTLKPDLPAKNIIAILASLDNLLTGWDIVPIGKVWAAVSYDPQQHQADSPDIQPNETVYVRFVGYQRGDRILIPAKVSRTLPSTRS